MQSGCFRIAPRQHLTAAAWRTVSAPCIPRIGAVSRYPRRKGCCRCLTCREFRKDTLTRRLSCDEGHRAGMRGLAQPRSTLYGAGEIDERTLLLRGRGANYRNKDALSRIWENYDNVG